MPPTRRMVNLEGSERKVVPGATSVGQADPNDRLRISIYVRANPNAKAPSVEAMSAVLPGERKYLSHDQAAAAFGADPADLAKVVAFAHDHQLTVLESDAARRLVEVPG